MDEQKSVLLYKHHHRIMENQPDDFHCIFKNAFSFRTKHASSEYKYLWIQNSCKLNNKKCNFIIVQKKEKKKKLCNWNSENSFIHSLLFFSSLILCVIQFVLCCIYTWICVLQVKKNIPHCCKIIYTQHKHHHS